MSDNDTQLPAQEPGVESRRKFLKVSVAAGAAVAAVAAGVHFAPSLNSAAKSTGLAANAPLTEALAMPRITGQSSDAMILVIDGDQIAVYKGEDKYVSSDRFFASQIVSAVRERL
jgi:hypothetical protein